MESPFYVKTVPCENGERFPMIVNREDGLPLFYPCVYLTTALRSGSKQDATLLLHLRAVKFVYDWGLKHRIDLERRFMAGEFLTMAEINCLAGDIYIRADKILEDTLPDDGKPPVKSRGKVAEKESYRAEETEKDQPCIKGKTAGTRLWYIHLYLDWLAQKKLDRVIKRSPEYSALVHAKDVMRKLIEARIPESSDQTDAKLGLLPEVELRLLEVIEPDSPDNPWKDIRVRMRNRLFIHILLGLGIRRGEALGLRINDLDFGNNTIMVHRTPDDKTDRRLHQPQTKTLARLLDMKKGLAHLCRQYIYEYRGLKLKEARGHHFLFVGIVTGKELASSSADKIYIKLREKIPELPKDFSHHLCRHTWNDRFSELADAKIASNEWQPKDEEKVRKLMMGWSAKSRMAERYAQRHNLKKANDISYELQKRVIEGAANDSD